MWEHALMLRQDLSDVTGLFCMQHFLVTLPDRLMVIRDLGPLSETAEGRIEGKIFSLDQEKDAYQLFLDIRYANFDVWYIVSGRAAFYEKTPGEEWKPVDGLEALDWDSSAQELDDKFLAGPNGDYEWSPTEEQREKHAAEARSFLTSGWEGAEKEAAAAEIKKKYMALIAIWLPDSFLSLYTR